MIIDYACTIRKGESGLTLTKIETLNWNNKFQVSKIKVPDLGHDIAWHSYYSHYQTLIMSGASK